MRGSELTPELIRLAYEQGAFPMGEPESGEVEFYLPRVRALLPIEGIHVSRSLRKVLRTGTFEIRFDTSFEEVMRACLRAEDNWITEDLIRVYTEIHRLGWAHCAESWREGRLVGGVYGLAVGSCFCAESMFYRETNASKAALWGMVNECRARGFTLFDAQLMNPHLESLGAFPISDREYQKLLADALLLPCDWDSWSPVPPKPVFLTGTPNRPPADP